MNGPQPPSCVDSSPVLPAALRCCPRCPWLSAPCRPGGAGSAAQNVGLSGERAAGQPRAAAPQPSSCGGQRAAAGGRPRATAGLEGRRSGAQGARHVGCPIRIGLQATEYGPLGSMTPPDRGASNLSVRGAYGTLAPLTPSSFPPRRATPYHAYEYGGLDFIYEKPDYGLVPGGGPANGSGRCIRPTRPRGTKPIYVNYWRRTRLVLVTPAILGNHMKDLITWLIKNPG